MEEKFDKEFKRKVKGINPEVPDVVKFRINDTLAALPERRSFRKYSYLSAIAALFLVCFVGIRYIFPMQFAKKEAPTSKGDIAMAANDSASNKPEKQEASMFTTETGTENNNVETNKEVADNSGDSARALQKPVPTESTAKADGVTYGMAAADLKVGVTAARDGSTTEANGIQLVLKTAIYDGKEIRVEFDKTQLVALGYTSESSTGGNTVTSSSEPDKNKIAGLNVAKEYEVRVIVNDIPLKCSINVIETPSGQNQYSGTMIIVPDSSLPENFNMILNFDKIGDASGQWLLTTEVSKK